DSCTSSLCFGGRENKRSTVLCSRTGCFTPCSLPWHTGFWLRPPTQLVPTLTPPSSASQRPCCFCSLSASTTRGTLSLISSSYADRSSPSRLQGTPVTVRNKEPHH